MLRGCCSTSWSEEGNTVCKCVIQNMNSWGKKGGTTLRVSFNNFVLRRKRIHDVWIAEVTLQWAEKRVCDSKVTGCLNVFRKTNTSLSYQYLIIYRVQDRLLKRNMGFVFGTREEIWEQYERACCLTEAAQHFTISPEAVTLLPAAEKN